MSQKKEYEDILANVTQFVDTKSTLLEDIKDDIKSNRPEEVNFDKIKKRCVKQAEAFVNNLVKFYLDGEVLNDPYVKDRMNDDKATLADLKGQMETSQYAITKLLQVVEEGGAINPRNFEVLSMLQKSKMEIVIHYEAVKTNIENNYRHLKSIYDASHETKSQESAGFGAKDLLDNLGLNMDSMIVSDPSSNLEDMDDIIDETDYIENNERMEKELKLPKGVKFYDADRS